MGTGCTAKTARALSHSHVPIHVPSTSSTIVPHRDHEYSNHTVCISRSAAVATELQIGRRRMKCLQYHWDPSETSVSLNPDAKNCTFPHSHYLAGITLLSGFEGVTTIKRAFCYDMLLLPSIDLSPLKNVVTIESEFMCDCPALTHIDISCMTSIQTIGEEFISSCENLSIVELGTALKKLRHIPSLFLGSDNPSLPSVDLSSLVNVTSIDSDFLARCELLDYVDLTAMWGLVTIGDRCMEGCVGLVGVELPQFGSITTIGWNFLSNCTRLTDMDLTPLVGVVSVGDAFLGSCTSITDLDLTPFATSLERIERGFLGGCTGLTSIDLTPLSNVSHIEGSFMYNCHGLRGLDVSPLKVEVDTLSHLSGPKRNRRRK